MKIINPKGLKFYLNDYVQISKHEQVSKGYTPNRSNEIFKIIILMKNNSTIYKLEDYEDNQIKDEFYTEEL